MRYDSEALEIKVVISRNGLLFKNIKISLRLLTSARKNTLYVEIITNSTCQQTQIIELVSVIEANIPSKSYCLAPYLIRKSTLQVYLAKLVAVDCFSSPLSLQSCYLPFDHVYQITQSTTIRMPPA